MFPSIPLYGTISHDSSVFTLVYKGTEHSGRKTGYSFDTFKGCPPELPIVDFRPMDSAAKYFAEVSDKCSGTIEENPQPFNPDQWIFKVPAFTPVPLSTFLQYCQNAGAKVGTLADHWNEINWPEPSNGDTAFVCHGFYAWSNACGYEVEISNDGDGARLRTFDSHDKPKVSRWLEIEYIPDEDSEEEEPEFVPVIDPNGFNIPLLLVMRV